MKKLLFLISVLFLSADAGIACICLPAKSAAEELKRATAVFSGKVVQIKTKKEPEELFFNVETVFEVEQAWKGVETKNISIFTGSKSFACGYAFQKGQTYLVYAYAYGEAILSTSICSRTKILWDAGDDLQELGTGKTITKSATENEIEELAKQFAQRLKETREFGPDVKKLFVDRFVDCHLRAELERKENGIFSQISASISPDVARQARDEELRRYLIAQLNLFHLKTLHRMSTRDLTVRWDDSYYPADQEYPPGIYDLLMKNPAIAAAATGENKARVTIRRSITNAQQLRSVLPTLEQAILAMREHFMKHLPEETELYKKNMERIGGGYSKFWDISFHNVSDKEAKEGDRCLGFAVRQFAIIKVPPFYRLFAVKAGKRFKLVSMLCTEPPCVD